MKIVCIIFIKLVAEYEKLTNEICKKLKSNIFSTMIYSPIAYGIFNYCDTVKYRLQDSQ